MELELTEGPDKLAVYRQQIADEDRPRMSEAAKAKLRIINERDRQNDDADLRLVKALISQPVTLEQLVDLFAKSFGGPTWSPRRRAIKAMHRLAHGCLLHHVTDLVILGELLPGEDEIPMSKFLSRYPLPEDETVIPKGTEPTVQKVRRCTLGKKCVFIKNRQPREIVGNGKYCSKACRGRANVLSHQTESQEVASQIRIDTGVQGGVQHAGAM